MELLTLFICFVGLGAATAALNVATPVNSSSAGTSGSSSTGSGAGAASGSGVISAAIISSGGASGSGGSSSSGGSGGGGTGGTGGSSSSWGGAYTCDRCGNSYARPHSLNRHVRFECGVEPKFECPICHKKSKHKHNLVLHMRTHQHR